MHRAHAAARGLAALTVIVAMVTLVPWFLLTVVGNPYPPEGLAWDAPLTDDAVVGALAGLCWVFWAQMLACLTAETVAVLRRGPAPRIRLTLGGQQHLARALVNAVLVTATATGVTGGLTGYPAPAAATEPVAGTDSRDQAPASRAGGTTLDRADSSTGAARVTPVTGHRVATAVPGDSLWSLAEQHLGDPRRWPEIARLNRGRAMPDGARFTDADLIRPGWALLMPADATGLPPAEPTGPADGTVTVLPGDTLSGLAEQHLGQGSRWPLLYRANRDRIQDPDLLQPGWRLTVLTSDPSPRPADPDTGRRHPTNDTGVGTRATAAPRRADPPATDRPSVTVAPTSHPDTPAGADTPAARWMLPGLAGTGAVLAGSLLLLLRVRRRAQARSRRPGRTISVPAPSLAPVEKTLVAAGSGSAPRVQRVDTLLRRLAARQVQQGRPMPGLAAVELDEHSLVLHLGEPCDLPDPWLGAADRTRFSCDPEVDADLIGPAVPDQPAPYPMLATVGTGDTGHVWLLNPEHAGVISITGDPARGRDLARYLTAELACNPWAAGVRVDCVGVAGEVAAIDPERVRVHRSGGQPVAEALADAMATLDRAIAVDRDVPTARAGQLGEDTWPGRLLLLAAADADTREAAQLLHLVADHPGGTGTCVVVLAGDRDPGPGVVLEVTGAGRVLMPATGLDLEAVGLTGEEAHGCAAVLAQSEDLQDTGIPHDTTAVDGWRAYADHAGALRDDHTVPRDTPPDDLAEPAASVLDGPDEEYLRAGATTGQDLAALAPRVETPVRSEVEQADPTLDADLDTWFGVDCDLPRLVLLGPVHASAHGSQAAAARRRSYYTELLAYLATRPHGATPAQVADAFGITVGRARGDVKVVRDWLGVDPRTGDKHLPDATRSAEAKARGVGVYQVTGLLVDADLFRRLRVRGQARGPAGLEDLRTALRLVTGPPFDQPRTGGWSWLYEGDRLDQHLVCAIVDVAHLVTTAALREGDLPGARAAAELAARAAPYEEIPRLDLAAVTAAEGNHQEADHILRRDVCNRSDDGQAPLELSQRTEDIIAGHHWLRPGKTAS
jgi:nucleoid-associated protein YgaU